MFNRRLFILLAAVLLIVAGLEIRLFCLQIVRGGEYADSADQQRLALVPSEVARARILTRDGKVLAEDRAVCDVSVVIGVVDPSKERLVRNPLRRLFYVSHKEKLVRIDEAAWTAGRSGAQINIHARSRLAIGSNSDGPDGPTRTEERSEIFALPQPIQRSLTELAQLSGKPLDELVKNFMQAAVDAARYRIDVFTPVAVIEDASFDVIAAVETRPADFRGFTITHRFVRHTEPMAAHLVGYVQTYNEDDVRAAAEKNPWVNRSFFLTQRTGRAGIEKSMNDVLQGEIGVDCIERNNLNQEVAELKDAPPCYGRDVVLTIDSRLQAIVEKELAASGHDSAAVVIDVATGEILAMASYPTYDPSNIQASLRGHGSMFDIATMGYLPPGSVFKTVTGLAALEKGTVPPEVNCTGAIRFGSRLFRCDATHGPIGLRRAYEASCNNFFQITAQKTGDAAWREMATRLGFGRPTGVELPGEKGGRLPDDVRGGELLNVAIGQGGLTVTPLQVAQLMAAIADGREIKPTTIIRGFRSFAADSPVMETHLDSREPRPLNLKQSSIDAVREGLYRVVYGPEGTARRAFAGFTRFKLSGKTGTAQHAPDDVGWFAGYAPSDNPRIAFAVVVDHIHTTEAGGTTAGPIVRRILEAIPADLVAPAEGTP